MAVILHTTGRSFVISAVCRVGRGNGCDLYLTSDLVSTEHALFRWSGADWELRDLGSSNGTWCNGQRLQSGVWRSLAIGDRLAFGERDEIFEIVNLAAPVVVAYVLDDKERQGNDNAILGDDEGLMLPNAREPNCLIQEDAPGRWFLHDLDADEHRAIDDNEIVNVGRSRWRISLPLVPERTRRPEPDSKRIEDIGLRFSVSLDQEHVELTVLHDGSEQQLRTRSELYYFLLFLARARLRDRDGGGLPEAEQGWLYGPELVKMLDKSKSTLRSYALRARRVFENEVGVVRADRVIERRRNTQKLRIGVSRLEWHQVGEADAGNDGT